MAATISVLSYPKVNLALDILKKDPTGYHEIRTIFHLLPGPVDEIILENSDRDIVEVTCDNPKLPVDETNTIVKAAKLLKKQAAIKCGAKIFLKKRIPLMSGLGGGSSNAVAGLKGLARLWGVKCCEKTSAAGSEIHAENCILLKVSSQIGMDCPFFFFGGTALGEHFGEKITSLGRAAARLIINAPQAQPLPDLSKNIKFEVIGTGVEISSHWAYGIIDTAFCGKNLGKTECLIRAIKERDATGVLENLHNDFEEFIFAKYPVLKEKKEKLEREKGGRVILCGSGGALCHCERQFFQ